MTAPPAAAGSPFHTPPPAEPGPTIKKLIVNSPYRAPAWHWRYDTAGQVFRLEPGRRPAGYVVATPGARAATDPGTFVPLPLVNRIRERVDAWRAADYPGVTGVTRRLLEHWNDEEQRQLRPFFFCQLEAIETLIWLTEALPDERVGIQVPSDGGPFPRLCSKMATGAGKTAVMAMLVAWQALNKHAYPRDRRFSRNVLVLAPGLTVKSRLQVLVPSSPGNYYDDFNIVPPGLGDGLRKARVRVHNWHLLMPLNPDAGPKVLKKGPESDEAFTRRVLGDMATARNLVVINDEAHHAWRPSPGASTKGLAKEELEQATKWVEGLDRLHATRGILSCFDLSATPFAPTGSQGEETLFEWIVSDFGLSDAIEAGLVKTPRVVVRDDGRYTTDYKSRLYHIYADRDVRSDLGRKAEPHEPLPSLVTTAYLLLGKDWLETRTAWRAAGVRTPPVMITVANRTETAARVEYAFAHGQVLVEELQAPERTLRIDSKVLARAEERDEAPEIAADAAGGDAASGDEEDDSESPEAAPRVAKKDQAELLRRTVDTVGQVGQPGEHIQNVISVAMLSEGWDTKTVTHVMGLRAFTSQLLCEQVVGRGLRRTHYEMDLDGLLLPEYVNVFGVPFTFLPHESDEDGKPPPPRPPAARIEALASRTVYEITWPNVLRVEREVRDRLVLDLAKVAPLVLDATLTPTTADRAPILAGKPSIILLDTISLEEIGRRFRLQKLVFEAAAGVLASMRPTWKGTPEALLAQLLPLVERFIASDLLQVHPPLFNYDDLRRRLVIALHMNRVVQHVFDAIRTANSTRLVPVFDAERPIRSTGDMAPWFTTKPVGHTTKSHIGLCVYDSTWEATEAYTLDHAEQVAAWAKNDHLGFEVFYVWNGAVRKYRPDFLVKLLNGTTLVVEVKGQDSPEQQAKRKALAEWTAAVQEDGRFGRWAWDVCLQPGDVSTVLARHA